MLIDLPRFMESERPAWSELEQMLDRLETDPGYQLDLRAARRFHFLYQKVSAALARINTFASEPALRQYLESLVARAYGEIHETRLQTERFHLGRWFFRGFPSAFRKNISAFWVALLITLAGAIFGAAAVAFDDEAKDAIIPAQFAGHLGDPAKRVAEEEAMKDQKITSGEKTAFSAMLMRNNISVSIRALAFGATWGIGTIILLFYNGVLLGLIAFDYIRAGQTVFLLGWLLPHGVIEIPAVLIAGQGGLLLARALIGWGTRVPMKARLRLVAPDLALLVVGFSGLLVWAGIVEAFLSQYHAPVIPYWLKIGFGVVELLVLIFFLKHKASARTRPARP